MSEEDERAAVKSMMVPAELASGKTGWRCNTPKRGPDGAPLMDEEGNVIMCPTTWSNTHVQFTRCKPHYEKHHPEAFATAKAAAAARSSAQREAAAVRNKRERERSVSAWLRASNRTNLLDTLAELFSAYGLPFRLVEAPLFRAILCPGVQAPSRDTVRDRVVDLAQTALEP